MPKPEIATAPQLSLEQLDRLPATDLVLWLASDERPFKGGAGLVDWRANGWLSRLVVNGQFRCQKGERMLTLSQGRLNAQRVFLLGVGESKSYNARSAAELAGDAAKILDEAAATDIALALPGSGDADAHRQLLESLVAELSKSDREAKLTTWGPWRKP
jgi:hypothetical protein